MNENGTKRRDWVKNAAIVFLTVMLLLTFFSQTIMNYSLPEVATQYVQSGTITAKIRGAGTVESGDPYEVKVTETRKVASVAVRVGAEVQKGDILYYLEDKDSDELQAALEALEKAEKAYENALLNTSLTSSDIQEAESGVTIEEYRNRITVKQNAVKAAENAIKVAENNIKAAENEVTEAQKKVDEITERYEAFNTQIKIEESRNDEGNSEERHSRDRARNEYNAVYDAWSKTRPDIAKKLEEARESLDALNANYQAQIDAANEAGDIAGAEELKGLWNDDVDVKTAKQKVVDYENELSGEDKKVDDAKAKLDAAQKALEIKMEKDKTDIINSLRRQQGEVEDEKREAEKVLTDKKNAVTERTKELADRTKDLEDRQKELTDLNAQIDRIFGQTGLQTLQENIDKAQEEVDKLREKTTGATITAPISGTITSLNVTAGNSTSADTPVAVMQPEGRGYTLSFSVTNEQARRLSVGDKADLINAWRYDDIEVTLSSIRPDNTDPGQKKLLTFDVTGSTVTAGQTLNLSVGQKSANYDLIVPNSAIREDNNGKFILIVESKSSPLGTRYTASRVDVEVIASDDTQSAISAALYGYEFVITTSTKPVEAGKLVRLASN